MRKLKIITLAFLVIISVLLILTWFISTQPLFFTEKNLSQVKVDTSSLHMHVKTLSEKYAPRDYLHTENLDSVASYIMNEFKQTNGKVMQQIYNVDSLEYKNIILQIGPDSNERIVIGAHYDAAGPFPGADDNASGVAGLIELAFLLDQISLPIMVELVAYTLEEPPFFRTSNMGSSVHATALKNEGVIVRMMISLEMIGYFSFEENSQYLPFSFLEYFYPSKGNWIAIVGDLSSWVDVRNVKIPMVESVELPVYSFNVSPKILSGIDWSDHLNYWNNDFPAVMITNTAYLRNPNYHTENDTAEKLNYELMADVVIAVYETVIDLSQ